MFKFPKLNKTKLNLPKTGVNPLAAGGLFGILSTAIASIAGSAAQIAAHEKRHNKKNRIYTTLKDSGYLKEMAKRKQPEYTVTFPNSKRRKTAAKSNGTMVAYQPGGTRSRTIEPPVSEGVIVSKTSIPRFVTRGQGTLVSNTEIISSVTLSAAGAFAAFNLAFVPSVPTWLARIADLYSKYRWRAVRIIYVPSCPTTTSGTIGMALTYDRQDALPASIVALSQTNRALMFPPYAGYGGTTMLSNGKGTQEAIYIDVDVSRFEKPWYNCVEATTLAAMAVALQTLYCPCTVQIASEGGPVAATAAGNLYLQYVAEFIEPINPTMNV